MSKNDCICIDDPDLNDLKDLNLETNQHESSVGEVKPHAGLTLYVSVQSPIAIEHESSRKYDHFEPLEFHGHWDNVGSATFSNTGYTAMVRLDRDNGATLQGGPLHEDLYVFEQLHFHWSDNDDMGCEHIFEGRAFSMEAHAVHYNQKYSSFGEAADKPDGLAVVAFFLHAEDDYEINAQFELLSSHIKNITKISSACTVSGDCLKWIDEQAHCKGYYTYHGSLTTEPYNESVTWIIYPNPIKISKNQVSLFRTLGSSNKCDKQTITKNVRPLQQSEIKHEIIYARAHR